jgi:cation diffusion facilitator family transporter
MIILITYIGTAFRRRKEMTARESMAKKVAVISLIGNMVLTIGKLLVGWFGNSEAVFADGVHSGADVFASLIVLVVIKIANKPADQEHPYGHGKAEVIVSAMVGIILLIVSLYVVYEAITSFFHPISAPSILAMWVALFSYISKEVLYRYSFKIAKANNSKAIEAIAFDHKADIVASIASALGVILSIAGHNLNIHLLLYGDKVASIVVAYLIFKIAKEMLKEAFDILMERNIDSDILNDYQSIISNFPEVRRIDKIRAREHGYYVLVDLRISVDYEKTIKEGHDLSKKIKQELMTKHGNIEEVLIHLNPYYPNEYKMV